MNQLENEKHVEKRPVILGVNIDEMTINEQIRIKRAVLNMSQPALVKLLGFSSTPYLSRVEQGKRPVPPHMMGRVQEWLYEEE